MNDNATYYSNRAAAYLELGWYDKKVMILAQLLQYFLFEFVLLPSDLTCSFQQAEEDCTKAISLDKKVSGETWNFATNINELF